MQNVAMAKPGINQNSYYVQNGPHKCEIKPEKFHFHIFCCFDVIKESLIGEGRNPPQVR